jgi:cardiolipin synthase (CMP-forming)
VYVEEYLQELRRDRFTPRATARYVRRAFARARGDMLANPGAVRSIWSLGVVFFALCFVGSAAIALWDELRLALDFFFWTTLAMLAVFVAITLHVDLLRDRQGYRLSAVNLPTAVTLLRFCLAPGITLFLAERQFTLALGVFLVATLSDVADGWLARRLNQITRLGTVLDPIVDILFNVVVFAGLFLGRIIPAWVLTAALLRYAIFLFGGAYLYLFVGPVTIRPTLFGRTSGVVMVGLMGFLVLLHVQRTPWAVRLAPLTTTALGVLLVAAVGQVLALGWYNLRLLKDQAGAQSGVVGDVRWGRR